MSNHPMDDIEVLNTTSDLARLCRQMFESLVASGFDDGKAFLLTRTYLNAIIGGSMGAQANE